MTQRRERGSGLTTAGVHVVALGSALAGALALAGLACAGEASGVTGLPAEVLVLPLAGLEDGQVRQCGVRVVAGLAGAELTADIALERRGRFADLAVRGSVRNHAGTGRAEPSALADLRLEPRNAELPDMPPHDTSGGQVERRSAASDPRVTAFIQDLMLAGVVIVITRADGTSERIPIQGPLSASVRAAYLNCAGDLYRPGE